MSKNILPTPEIWGYFLLIDLNLDKIRNAERRRGSIGFHSLTFVFSSLKEVN